MTASGFVTTRDCTRRWQTAAIRGRRTSKVSRRPGSHHTNLNMKTDKHVCSPQCLSAARDACRRTYERALARGSWPTMQIAKRALEFLSSPVEHTERIASVPQSLD